VGWTVRYFDSYYLTQDHTILAIQGSATVPSQLYHDLFGSYRWPSATSERSDRLLANTELRFGAHNVFNKEPPLDLAASGGELYFSPYGDPRLANYYVSVSKHF
jgi:outer membrane receptor protein involved in Fe transport